MPIVATNAKPLSAADREEMVLQCLKDTRCEMTPLGVREWIQDHKLKSIPEDECRRRLQALTTKGLANHTEGTRTFKAARP